VLSCTYEIRIPIHLAPPSEPGHQPGAFIPKNLFTGSQQMDEGAIPAWALQIPAHLFRLFQAHLPKKRLHHWGWQNHLAATALSSMGERRN